MKIEPGYFAKRSFTGRAVAGRTSDLAFERGGKVTAISVDLGHTVEVGDMLATLDTARLAATKNQLLAQREEAKAKLNLADRTLARAQDTFKQGHASAQRLDEAEANAIGLKASVTMLTASLAAVDVDISASSIKAPFNGTITARLLDEGTVVMAGTALLELTETDRMEGHIGMPPEHAAAVKAGAFFQLYDGRGKVIEGPKLRAVLPIIEGRTRTVMVTFDLPPNATSRGELVSAAVQDWREATGAWLPLRALSSDVRGLWRVYKVVTRNGEAQVQFENVQILYSDANRAFVTGTLSNGDIVISDGMARLAPGQRVSLGTSTANQLN
ncbi:MAG: efflux RND transporter periplasmic adaptor subunit [Kordiimonadaceae bacterium]|nr:efflux RND transporter periplasmic adaptor subunit [Kordiimonadaceae bacterium]